MSGNGAGTVMVIIVVVRRIIRGDHHRARAVCVGVVAGTAVPVAAGLLFAITAVRATATAT